MKRFYNHRNTIVKESVEGLLCSSHGTELAMLENKGGSCVVLRKNLDKKKVALLSGGGSGHEPMHAGFVGEGMLTGAICGALFASPGSQDILAGILAVTGDAGCLVIVKNYMGDRLNFGSAVSEARALGLKVEMVLVGDDIALGGGTKARGLAGVVLIHKIAGAAAQAGKSLEEVAEIARNAAANLHTLGLGLTSCTPYDAKPSTRIAENQVEVGIGIHGEAGAAIIPYEPLTSLMETLVKRLLSNAPEGDFFLLVNILGITPIIEAQAIISSLALTPLSKRVKMLIGPAAFCTSLDMSGVSLTIMPAQAQFLELLSAPTKAPYWVSPVPYTTSPVTLPVPILPTNARATASANPRIEKLMQVITTTLENNEAFLNSLDAKAGDGDCGSTYADAARRIATCHKDLPFADISALFGAVGRLLSRYSGGSSGALFSILFANAAENKDWRQGLLRGVEKMEEYGGAQPGDRTVLDVLRPAVECLAKGGTIEETAKLARAGAEATKTMKAQIGRASYVPPEQILGVPDAGAEGVARVFEALAHENGTHTSNA
ncbi:DAK2 domain-containing protein [Acetobacteraceae bacterium]|nr:DAK2 domain-containing protein [Acetobacteraceae bacterium]